MSVDIGIEEGRVTRAWYDRRTGLLCAEINGIVEAIDLAQIPNDDFESNAPIIGISVGCEGAVVVCRHEGGSETWFPADLWLPGGFTPPERKKR